jgi:formylglycine-generating enzyme required for sulfatase activity
MRYFCKILVGCFFAVNSTLVGQTFSDSLLVLIPGGTFIMGESESNYQGPPNNYDAFIHTVTLTSFQIGKTEITNQQYVAFLNAALSNGLIEVRVESNQGPDMGSTLVFGTDSSPEIYKGQAILNLSGTRVMKDHDNDDGDNDPFTGVIEPENPLNICYVGFDETRGVGNRFYVKDPANPDDFDWVVLTNYYNYTNVAHLEDTSVLLNDYSDWEEFSDYPNNLPTLKEVKNWPATFIRWYGAKAFVMYYGIDLPTEAQWEYAAQGGEGFVYATSDGNINGDGTSANWNHLQANPSLGHVLDVRNNEPNPYGLYNMAGNVWEWLEDWYASGYYSDADGATDPVNNTDSGFKVRRGGSWNYHLSTLKSAARAKDEQFKGNDHFGFRVVKNSAGTAVIQQDEILRKSFKLYQNYPNPFNPSTNIAFDVFKPTKVELIIFDLLGQEVRTLVNGTQKFGNTSVVWDGKNNFGLHVSTGIFICRLRAHEYVETKKLLLMR